jgi:two-component system OmpR family response regulator
VPTHRTGQRILVVDDDKAILDLVNTRLTLAGYNVFSARNGHEALTRLSSLRPAAMVLDLNMPSLDGFGVLERMGREWTARTPTLVLTARQGNADVKRAIQLGARDYLAKPFKDSDLLMRVARLFRRPADAQSLEQAVATIEQMLD